MDSSPSTSTALRSGLHVRELSKRLGDFRLNIRSLDIERGCTSAIIGRNGAGKSTLLACLSGVMRCDAGEVTWEGQPLARALRAGMRRSFCLQDQHFIEGESVEHLLEICAGASPYWDRDRAVSCRVAFELPARGRVAELSRGMRVKLGLLIALAQEPELLILDEPFAFLDVVARDFVRQALSERKSNGAVTLVSLHDLDAAIGIVDEVLVMDTGKLTRRIEASAIPAGKDADAIMRECIA